MGATAGAGRGWAGEFAICTRTSAKKTQPRYRLHNLDALLFFSEEEDFF